MSSLFPKLGFEVSAYLRGDFLSCFVLLSLFHFQHYMMLTVIQIFHLPILLQDHFPSKHKNLISCVHI